MYTKLIALTVGVVLTVAGLASSATAAPGSCPEARTACQPIGERSDSKPPRDKVFRAKATPKVDSSGRLWRAGNHIMQ